MNPIVGLYPIIGPGEVRALIRHACKANGCEDFADVIRWHWNGRFTRRMGDANPRTNVIRLSRPLFPRASPEEQRETVIHEACHLISIHKHGAKGTGHGRLWKLCMMLAGGKGDRCHKVDRTGLKRTRRSQSVPARCGCGTITSLTPHRAARLRNGTAIYRCRRCRCSVTLVEDFSLDKAARLSSWPSRDNSERSWRVGPLHLRRSRRRRQSGPYLLPGSHWQGDPLVS